MKPKTTNDPLHNLLRERFAHNLAYLGQSNATRTMGARLTYGIAVTPEWLDGERAAIVAENEFIEATLKSDPQVLCPMKAHTLSIP